MKRSLTLLLAVALLFIFASCTTYSTAVSPTFASGTSASSGAGTANPKQPEEEQPPVLPEPETKEATVQQTGIKEVRAQITLPAPDTTALRAVTAANIRQQDSLPTLPAVHASTTSVRPTPGMSTASVISIPVPTDMLGLSVSAPVRITPEQYIRYCQQRTARAPSSAVLFPEVPGVRLWP